MNFTRVSSVKYCASRGERNKDKSVELNVGNIAAFTSKMNYLFSIIRDVQRYICPNITVAQMIKSEKYLPKVSYM